jgi:SAM-dependent methyltransferase
MQSVSFDRAASFYDATRGYTPGTAERICAAIVATTGARVGTRFLELGVGTGRIALPFIAGGYSYTGVDISSAMLVVLRGKTAGLSNTPVLVQGDVLRLPFAAASFDVAIGVHVLHLVADWRTTLAEARRALRPRAHLLLVSDRSVNDDDGADPASLTPPARARHLWDELLAEHGLSGREGQPGARPEDPAVPAYLAELGARVAEVDLAEYERLPISAEGMVRTFRERMFSSDWARPDDVHTAIVARMERWLSEECPDPATPYGATGRFKGLMASWGEDPAAV